MTIATMTFKFFTDSGLTVAFSNLYQLTFKTDLTDATQTMAVLYFGSAEAAGTRQLQATSSPGVDPITLTPTVIIPTWAAATAYTLGQTRIPTVGNTYRYEISTAGTSHATVEPTWPTTIGATVSDGTAVWTCASKVHPTTEIRLSLDGVTYNSAGAALNIASNTILSGVANAVPVYIKRINSVATVGSNTGTPELGLYINAVEETIV